MLFEMDIDLNDRLLVLNNNSEIIKMVNKSITKNSTQKFN